MKKSYLFLIVLFLVGCTQKKEPVTKYSIEQFYENLSIYGGSFSPDESKLLVSSNESGIYNAYEIDLVTGERKQMTFSEKESSFAVSYLPCGTAFLYTADQGGNENNHIYMQGPGDKVTDLTPFEDVRSGFWGMSRDEEGFYISSNKRDARFMDLYKRTFASLTDAEVFGDMLYQNNEGMDPGAISPNERYLALVRSISSADSKMYLYDRETGETMDISEHEGDVQYSPQYFSLDNKDLYFTSDEGSDFVYLAKMDLETKEVSKVFEADWDVWYAYTSFNEKFQVIGINEDARTNVKIYNLQTGEEVLMPQVEGGSISSVNISKSEKLARLTVSTSSSPSNIYVYDFESGELNKQTSTLNPDICADDLVEGKVVRYKSFDGLEIPAIYYQPKDACDKNKVPGLVWVHGGPGGQSRLSYFAMIQYLTNHGYAILAVNNRGSSGYGKTFFHLDDRNHGDKDLKDCIAGKEFFESTGVVDMDKIGIVGGSYGGYMVMAALTYAPEEFALGVNIFGVTNWLRTLKSIPPYWESYRKALYDELGDPTTADSVRLYEISPLFHASAVTKPLMVLQGANDVRVLQVESDEIVEAVKANGVLVEYLVFDDEGHGFRKKENEIEGYSKVKDFLDQNLKACEE